MMYMSKEQCKAMMTELLQFILDNGYVVNGTHKAFVWNNHIGKTPAEVVEHFYTGNPYNKTIQKEPEDDAYILEMDCPKCGELLHADTGLTKVYCGSPRACGYVMQKPKGLLKALRKENAKTS